MNHNNYNTSSDGFDPDNSILSSESEQSTSPTKPDIMLSNRPLQDISDDCYSAILSSNKPPSLFMQGGKVDRLKRDENSRLLIEDVTIDILRNLLVRWVNFTKIEKTENGPKIVVADPPDKVIRDLLARSEWDLPPLSSIISCPTFRIDGTLLEVPGYDQATGLYYDPENELKGISIAENPTKDQAHQALDLLSELFIDFPFDDDSSKANALGLTITAFVLPAITGRVPLALIDATKQGTGKGLLVDVIATIIRGNSANVSTVPKEDDEWRKRITSLLMMGSQFIVFDNIDKPL